jgi:hypothetical protein
MKVRLRKGRDQHDLVNGVALFKSPESMKQKRDARQRTKLLQPFPPGARAPPGGDYDGNIHKTVTSDE